MKLSDGIRAFLKQFRAAGNSESTDNGYRNTLSMFEEFKGDVPLETIQPDDLDEFLNNYLPFLYIPRRPNGNTDPLSKSSIVNHWSALRSFFEWAYREGIIQERPDEELEKPQADHRKILPILKVESDLIIQHLLRQIRLSKTLGQVHTAQTNLVIWLVLLDTGLRVGEMVRLEYTDYRPLSGSIFVQPYGNFGQKTKSRLIPLSTSVINQVGKLIAIQGSNGNHERLIKTVTNEPLSRSSVYHRVVDMGEAAGILGMHPHRCRHSFAYNFISARNGTVEDLAYFLGHASTAMSEMYADLAFQNLHLAA